MLHKRLIPCLFLQNGLLVRSQQFREFQILGNPVNQLERYTNWDVDEVIYIDISENGNYDLGRDDMKTKDMGGILSIIETISKICFMPMTFGGKIRTLQDIKDRLDRGADKITINTKALASPEFITRAAKVFGSQCIVASIDVKKNQQGNHEVYYNHGRTATGKKPEDWAQEVEKFGAGEIFLNSIDRDGTGMGYDIELIKRVVNSVSIPVIACGGASDFSDFVDLFNTTDVSAVAAGNIFNFTENSYIQAKRTLRNHNILVR